MITVTYWAYIRRDVPHAARDYTQSVVIKYGTRLYVKDATNKQNEDCRRYN